jgi:hypothetical protein
MPQFFFVLAIFKHLYSEFFLTLAIGFYVLIFQPPVNFCPSFVGYDNVLKQFQFNNQKQGIS